MLTATNIDISVGHRELIGTSSFQVAPGDRIGLVGRNGAGKTTLARVLAGETQPTHGQIRRQGEVAYLPQDPRTGMSGSARDRILSGRGLDALSQRLSEVGSKLGAADELALAGMLRRYSRLEAEFEAAGGWAAESEAATIAANLGLPERVLSQDLATLSGGQRRRIELSRVLFSGASTLLLDEPTNHLDQDSILWLKSYLRDYSGGLLVISHDVDLIESTVNRIFHLDATRSTLDIYNMGWRAYLAQQASDDRRRNRERQNVERKAVALRSQADRMRATATKARTAHQLDRRAANLLKPLAEGRAQEKVARIRFPDPAPCGKTPLRAEGLAKHYGSLEVFSGVDLAIDKASRVVVLGLNGAGKTTLLRILGGVDEPDAGEVLHGHGVRIGYYAQEHETLLSSESVYANIRRTAPASVTDVDLRRILGSFLFSGDRIEQRAGTLSGGEKTRLALAMLVVSAANVLLLDEPTNNLDPLSRAEVFGALERYAGAIVLVTHDPGAIQALNPERVLLMPDGIEDFWSAGLADLVELA